MSESRELTKAFERLKNNQNEIAYFIEYAKENFRINPEDTARVLRNVLELCRELSYDRAIACSEIWLGWYYHDKGKFDEALRLHNDALMILERMDIDDNDAYLSVYNALMVDYIKKGMMDLAIKYGIDGWQLSLKVNNDNAKIYFLVNTAMAFVEDKKYEEAEKIINIVLNVNCVIPDGLMVLINSFIAECEFSKRNYESVLSYCDAGIKCIKNQEDVYMNGFFYLYKAESFYKTGNYEQAQINYETAYEYGKSMEDLALSIDIIIKWSRFLSFRNEIDLAHEKLNEALDMSRGISSDKELSSIYDKIGEIYFENKSFEKAYKALRKSNEYKSKLFEHNSSQWYAKLKNEVAIDEGRMYKELYNQISVISHFGVDMLSDVDEQKTLKSMYKSINKLMSIDIFGIAIYDEKTESLDYRYFISNNSIISYGSIPVNSARGYGVLCFNSKKEFLINDLESELKKRNKYAVEEELNAKHTRSFMYCPLIANDRVIGVVTVQNYNKNSFSNMDLNKLKLLSSFIAVALENITLFKRIEYMAVYDGLTGVYNRNESFRLGREIVKGNQNTGVLMADIDDFKRVNDTYGHQKGDEVLAKVASIIQKSIPENSVLGRYGGEEFVVVIGNKSKEQCIEIAEQVRKNVSEYVFQCGDKKDISVTISIGIGSVRSGNQLSKGIKEADEALYRAKHNGKNCVE